jgi:hypothetical protein
MENLQRQSDARHRANYDEPIAHADLCHGHSGVNLGKINWPSIAIRITRSHFALTDMSG